MRTRSPPETHPAPPSRLPRLHHHFCAHPNLACGKLQTTHTSMGLFSRKHGSRHANGDQHNQNNGDVRLPANTKRANGNPAQNATFPNVPLPKAPDPNLDPAGYLRSIYAVRERSRLVLDKAKRNQLRHFTVDMSKFADTANYVVAIIKVCRAMLVSLTGLVG